MTVRHVPDKPGALPPSGWTMIYEIDIARLVALHNLQRRLCDQLERCADLLPDCHALASAAAVTAAFEASWREPAGNVLHNLFGPGSTTIEASVLSRLRRHRVADQLHTDDLREALEAADADNTERADALGYMMRCLFDGCRRAIDCEQIALLLLAGNRLTDAARRTMFP